MVTCPVTQVFLFSRSLFDHPVEVGAQEALNLHPQDSAKGGRYGYRPPPAKHVLSSRMTGLLSNTRELTRLRGDELRAFRGDLGLGRVTHRPKAKRSGAQEG